MLASAKCSILLLLGLCALHASAGGNDNGDSEGRDNMEHLFPLLFLMGGAPSIHCPAIWILGTLMLGMMLFMAKIKNL